MERRVTKLETDMAHMARAIDTLTEQVSELNESLARYRGAWGMLLMMGGAVISAIAVWVNWSKG